MAVDTIMMIFPEVTYTRDAKTALQNADECLVMTKWPEFAKLNTEFNAMKTRTIIDERHFLTISDVEWIC